MTIEPVHLYAALVDVLAYRHHLEKDRKSGSLDFHDKLSAALRVFDEVNDSVFRVQAISDTVIMTCVDHDSFPEFLDILRKVFLAFLAEGLFVRGGIAYSRHFQSNRLTYSHAVARAYDLESRFAVYPRIVIDPNIIAMYEVGQDLPAISSSGMLCMENRVCFLDILTQENWQQVYEHGKRIYAQDKEAIRSHEDVFSKHLRFERYVLASPYAPTGVLPYIKGIEQV